MSVGLYFDYPIPTKKAVEICNTICGGWLFSGIVLGMSILYNTQCTIVSSPILLAVHPFTTMKCRLALEKQIGCSFYGGNNFVIIKEMAVFDIYFFLVFSRKQRCAKTKFLQKNYEHNLIPNQILREA